LDSHDKELLDRELFDQDLLDRVNLPLDLRKLNLAELKLYAGTLRTFLINQMSETGGHVAANLGVVELTVALHYSFKTPDDKLIWDVGHQSYAHKVLTGRKKLFSTLRQEDGLSGFTRRSESEFDPFGAGHSSTAISAGLGIAEAEWQKKSSNFVISIVGDGALTAGMAFEGLNHAASLKRLNHIIVINDNEYSISENIGAIANFFSPTSVNTVPGASPLTSRAGEFFMSDPLTVMTLMP
jgi:1-deoxy-D-xylulose-5-phosphate synthase